MKPDIVLIPGAWHTGSCYDLITPLLNSAGYHCNALTLPSVDASPPLDNMDPDVATIRTAVEQSANAGKDVVVVMHSYGGVPGTEAMRGLSKEEREKSGLEGGVVHLVYLTAWMVQEGESLSSAGGGRGGKGGPSIVKVEDGFIYCLDPIAMFYHDLPLEEAEKCKQQIKSHSVATFASLLTYPAYKHIPTTYLLCKDDQAIAYDVQIGMVQKAGIAITTVTCDAAHSPFLSMPELTVDVIRHAAGDSIG